MKTAYRLENIISSDTSKRSIHIIKEKSKNKIKGNNQINNGLINSVDDFQMKHKWPINIWKTEYSTVLNSFMST